MNSDEYLQQRSKEAQAWGKYLSQFRWDYFGTFTFAESYSGNGARRAFERFIKSYEIRPVQCAFYGIEKGTRYGRVHLHSLLQYSPEHRRSAKHIWAKWFEKYGRARVEEPDSQTSVASYTAKYTSKDMFDYDLIGEPIFKI